MISPLLVSFWLFGSLFGDSDCRIDEDQGIRTMHRIGEQWPLRTVEDPVSDYVQRIGMRLARVVDPAMRQPWNFYVLRNAEPSALAVGGGHFVISDGLIAFLRNESELAAVLAHEIAHQDLGHFCRGLSSAVERIDRGTVVQHYDLDVEMEADRAALRLLSAAGFASGAMASALRCLQQSPSISEPQLQSRILALEVHVETLSEGGDSSSVSFREARRRVEEDLGNSVHRDCR
ncbi:M48 family metallopeptidase [Candidatus Thiosymbion oneisti]|uniref:M48 family metallopeptidase n=1 Tax=Candidatus Thiosymbion oneisti TaxID=589554 RepID=UPI000B7DB3FC|nr:M48 family metallopeptidase [Candidatus Thiosymbion oneisti]